MHGISRYCYNVLEVLSVELRPYNPGLGQGLKVIYFEPQNIEVKNIVLFLKKLLLFEIPYSIFDIQNEKHAKAIRLKGEGFKPHKWKNKNYGIEPSAHFLPDLTSASKLGNLMVTVL